MNLNCDELIIVEELVLTVHPQVYQWNQEQQNIPCEQNILITILPSLIMLNFMSFGNFCAL